MFIKLKNGIPEIYTTGQLRRDKPNVSFPKDIPAETLEFFGVYKVRQTVAPQFNSNTHYRTQIVELIDGEWTQVWQILNLPLEQASENIRAHRDYLLNKTDWIVAQSYEQQISVPEDWVVYRQALRDIPTQEGFPYSVVWPVHEINSIGGN
jgi:hypothetical protein